MNVSWPQTSRTHLLVSGLGSLLFSILAHSVVLDGERVLAGSDNTEVITELVCLEVLLGEVLCVALREGDLGLDVNESTLGMSLNLHSSGGLAVLTLSSLDLRSEVLGLEMGSRCGEVMEEERSKEDAYADVLTIHACRYKHLGAHVHTTEPRVAGSTNHSFLPGSPRRIRHHHVCNRELARFCLFCVNIHVCALRSRSLDVVKLCQCLNGFWTGTG